MECPKSVIDAFQLLGTSLDVPENNLTEIEKYVCKLYDVKTHVGTLEELRWLFFLKKAGTFGRTTTDQSYIASSCTSGSFPVRNNDIIPNPGLLPPLGYGWCMNEDNSYSPAMTTNHPAFNREFSEMWVNKIK